jgi:twinfilin-like protein
MALSGISTSAEVKDAFANARQGGVRWLKLRINDTTVELDRTYPLSDSLSSDYDTMYDAVQENEPAYFVFRLDSKRDDIQSYEWLIILYVPDKCKVREKMLYSSTVDGVKRDLGSPFFAGDYHISVKKELHYSDFNWTHKSQRHIHSKDMYTEEVRFTYFMLTLRN